MTTKDQARDAKNAFIESLGGSMNLLSHGIGGVGISGHRGDWHVRVLTTDPVVQAPAEFNGVPFVTQYVSRLKALKERDA